MMETITLKYNKKSKAGKAIEAVLKALEELPGVEIIPNEDGHYNSEFVKKIESSEKQIKEGKFKILDTKDVWGSLGL